MKLLRRIPIPFWCYFLSMLAGTFGLIPRSHPLYTFLSQQLLPVCLVLLLIGTDLKALARLGIPATFLMLAGAVGTIAGGLISWRLYHAWLPAEAWGGIGALTGSWIGGSANMIAVKEALNVPDSIIGPLIIVDASVAYSWMALLIWSSAWKEKWTAWIGRCKPARGVWVDPASPSERAGCPASPEVLSSQAGRAYGGTHPRARGAAAIIAAVSLALTLSLAAQWSARRLPAMGAAFTTSIWTVLIVTTAALLLSLTPMRKLEEAGASKIGTFALYVLLISIGARADLRMILHTPVFLALGGTWILTHGLCLLLAGWALRAPLGLIATASQANIGGVVSAPIVGATFSTELASAGLLMAILGNVVGTYLGLGTALAARWLVPPLASRMPFG